MLIRNGSEGERLTGNVHCLCTKSRLSMTKCKMRVVPVFTLIINHCQRDERRVSSLTKNDFMLVVNFVFD